MWMLNLYQERRKQVVSTLPTPKCVADIPEKSPLISIILFFSFHFKYKIKKIN